jgi:glycerophosphoryl diester phosphodiesterase
MVDAARLNRPLLLGHRGARARKAIPENTFASFDQALADGCDGFEFDVRLTADGVAVVCHDLRASGVEIASAASSELQGFPHLGDVLVRYRDRAFLDIELKVGGIEKKAVALIKEALPGRGFIVSSFLPEVLYEMNLLDPEIPLGLICETHAELSLWSKLPVEYAIPHHKLAGSELVRDLKGAGKKVLVWTVNDVSDMRRFRDLGVDGIISDDTRLLCETLGCQGD